MTGNLGRKQRFSSFVVTGNKNGLAGELSGAADGDVRGTMADGGRVVVLVVMWV